MTAQVEGFLDELYEADRDTHRLVNQAILILERNGPAEGRPLVDSITASQISNMKKLRPPSAGASEIRILFCFDRGARPFCSWPETSPASGTGGIASPFPKPKCCTRPTSMNARRRSPMGGVKRWRDTDHLQRAIDTAGGPEAFDAAVGEMLDENRGWRLADLRKRREMTQEQVAARMGVSIARVSQIEAGDVSTQDVLARYIAALGGTLKLIADFGDEQLKVA